jgi:hypothetical protein
MFLNHWFLTFLERLMVATEEVYRSFVGSAWLDLKERKAMESAGS